MALSVAVFLVIAAMTWVLEAFAVVVIAGEVSCYEVCSPTTQFLDSISPLPEVVACVISLGAGGAASRIVVPPPRPPRRAH